MGYIRVKMNSQGVNILIRAILVLLEEPNERKKWLIRKRPPQSLNPFLHETTDIESINFLGGSRPDCSPQLELADDDESAVNDSTTNIDSTHFSKTPPLDLFPRFRLRDFDEFSIYEPTTTKQRQPFESGSVRSVGCDSDPEERPLIQFSHQVFAEQCLVSRLQWKTKRCGRVQFCLPILIKEIGAIFESTTILFSATPPI
jgi:hypothetical protein